MPTPVSIARQCLTDEAARALDDAVGVARRRSHAQTTSLHAISALLAFPSSTLRDACARARSSAYSPRLQFRALELSVGVSLDRLPSSKALEEPPVSNSLMAAIKRSQASQRRHPENFHLQQQNQTASFLRVELKHFILSILDDPIVSRVFGEAGFRSCDIKIAMIQPPLSPVSRFPRTRCPPIFLCNLTDSDPARRTFSFPFAGVSGSGDGDENSRRIGEVLTRKTGKNPLLIGVCSSDALRCFADCVERRKGDVLPAEIAGLNLICIEKEISEFVGRGGSEDKLGLKLKELGHMAEQYSGPGIAVNFGELKALVGDDAPGEAASFVVSKLTSLLKAHPNLWLMGSSGSYETYLKFLTQFPSIEEDWDLHLLPITSSRSSVEGFCSRSSLMGSFVPFAGFFSTPTDFKNPLNSTNQSITLCHLCNEKCEQEVSAILKGGSTISLADRYSGTLPSWLLMAEPDTNKGADAVKAKDDGRALNDKVLGVQKKWYDICQRLHHAPPYPKSIFQPVPQVSGAECYGFIPDRRETSSKDSSPSESGSANLSPSTTMNLQKISPSKIQIPLPVVSESESVNFQSKLAGSVSKSKQVETRSSPWFSPCPLPNLSLAPDRTSSSCITSVTTDLGLGTLYASNSQETKRLNLQGHKERMNYFSGSVSAEFDVVSVNNSSQIGQSPSCSVPDLGGQMDARDFKSLWRALASKVGWQDEAICAISQTVSSCRTGNARRHGSNLKGDIWLSFLGPDKVGKKRIAAALAEIMFRSSKSLVSVDLGYQHGSNQSNSIFDQHELNSCGIEFRGKTITDYIAGELRKKPQLVVFLENIDKADLLVQTSLSQAIRTGKFPDSHGREISINHMIFVTTATSKKGNRNLVSGKEPVEFSEERILGAKSWQMKILIGCVTGEASRSNGMNVLVTPREGTSNPKSTSKRKFIDTGSFAEQDKYLEMSKRACKASNSYLDLNLPVEELEEDVDSANCDSDSLSESSEAWLEEFLDQMDEKVTFKPFNFDAVAQKLLKEISLNFQKIIGSDIQLEIDSEVMVQILAAAWLSEKGGAVDDWVEQVLSKSFTEARQRYRLTAQSLVKLVPCEGLSVEEQAPGVCLPARIILN
ncbi:hypothetical protein VitviT2T_008332 [Vitis vinifera]|uniref:Clp R domain-containing protein n=1 Tax=Vitis vinifera TaxID=29760 RepID=A0ABY9C1Z2_VITVI|nr:protein SMAX1-LIKE 6 [Vitis vinifera]WJZ89086.1 hypothetical protein VitviT2T_008332 [Vitis vinifera]|eukprot:XP_002279036.1 PREDICTED: protein SMAX1-LIKE 6 [Vitis vinifera]